MWRENETNITIFLGPIWLYLTMVTLKVWQHSPARRTQQCSLFFLTLFEKPCHRVRAAYTPVIMSDPNVVHAIKCSDKGRQQLYSMCT